MMLARPMMTALLLSDVMSSRNRKMQPHGDAAHKIPNVLRARLLSTLLEVVPALAPSAPPVSFSVLQVGVSASCDKGVSRKRVRQRG